jgi:NTE family protein
MRSPLLLLIVLLAGCSTFLPPNNKAITQVDEGEGYRIASARQRVLQEQNIVLLAFSGGGTRAAALSYGVMQELRDTLIDIDGKPVRVLDEVDAISSVSGGSFTAAYYGLFRDRLFEDYEDEFLRQGVQEALIKQLFNPMHWVRSGFDGFNRTEMAIDYYDRIMFHGATFNDMAKNGPPFVAINATDLGNGLRFTFTQGSFDLICSDLGSYPVARAVTASSAVPVAFPPVVLANHAADCDISQTAQWQQLNQLEPESSVQARLLKGTKSYRDAGKRQYIHLVDGGVADNLGLRVLIDRVEAMNEQKFKRLADDSVKNILVILVNAQVNPERLIEESPGSPSVAATMDAVSSAQFDSYNRETLDRLRNLLAGLEQHAREADLPTRVHFAEVSFEHVKVEEVNRLLNALPTTLELEDIDVDRLIVAGRLLLRNNPDFQAFKQSTNASLAPGALSMEDMCRYFDHPSCRPAPAAQ